MIVEIDHNAGFCFGVINAISKVEELLSNGETVNCLGDIVHNKTEVQRLEILGMKTIQKDELESIHNATILIRSHGEPPSTYEIIKKNSNKLIEATCPVVLKLQQRIQNSYSHLTNKKGQIVIYGKKNHPEVTGLAGQTGYTAIIVSSFDDLQQINYHNPIEVYSQTTMPINGFHEIINEIQKQAKSEVIIHNTICRQVAGRVDAIKQFAAKFDVVLFISGKESSNGKFLHQIASSVNSRTYFISNRKEINQNWFKNINSIGITGATSTPVWQMKEIATFIHENF